jgi:DNA-binding transcriptional regulator YiaG
MLFAESCWSKPMSSKLSLKEALGRLGKTQTESRDHSTSLASVKAILSPGRIKEPVELARALRKHGMSLRKAHETLNRLTAGDEVAVALHGVDAQTFASEMAALGAKVYFIKAPPVDVKNVRAKFGISQAEFAVRFGLELDTIQNWEQGRYEGPDRSALLLLKIIEQYPQVVEAVLTQARITDLTQKSRDTVAPSLVGESLVRLSYRTEMSAFRTPWVVALSAKERRI